MSPIDSWRYNWQDVPWQTTQVALSGSTVEHVPGLEICTIMLCSDCDALVWLDSDPTNTDTTKAFFLPEREIIKINPHGRLAFNLHACAKEAGEAGILFITYMSPVSGV